MMKICSKCKVPQDEANFHKSSSWCKLCKKLKYRAEYKSAPLPEKPVRNIGRERELNKARSKKHAELNPKKRAARVAVRGMIPPARCMGCCQDKKLEAHHDDYNKPKVVRWLCKECHTLWHMNNTPIE